MNAREHDHIGEADRAGDEPQLPTSLKKALAELSAIPFDTRRSEALDQAVLSAARETFAARRRKRLAWSLAGPLAAAAGLALAVVVIWPAGQTAQRSHVAAVPANAADLNADGVVDILDAYALAKLIESAADTRMEHDFNADGVVDRLDVDALAGCAVRLSDAAPFRRGGQGGA